MKMQVGIVIFYNFLKILYNQGVMKQTTKQWSKEDMDKITQSYNECALIAEGHGWPKKKVEKKNTQAKKK
jgi:hypothetical protein